MSRGLLLLGLLGLLLAGVFAQTQRQTTRPAANANANANARASGTPMTRTVPATGAAAGGAAGAGMGASAGPAAGGVSASGGPRRGNNNNNGDDEDELEFNTEDQRGVFALGGRGSVLILDNPLTVDPTPDPIIANIALVGRFCADGNGTCAFKLFVNVQGLQTFTIENGPAATSSCTVTFTPGTGEATFTAVGFTVSPSANGFFDTETTFTGHIVFSEDDFAFFEIDGCGAAGLDQTISPPLAACENENFRFVEAAGFARRQDKFCNCSRVSANFEGEDEGNCPANNRDNRNDNHRNGPGGMALNF